MGGPRAQGLQPGLPALDSYKGSLSVGVILVRVIALMFKVWARVIAMLHALLWPNMLSIPDVDSHASRVDARCDYSVNIIIYRQSFTHQTFSARSSIIYLPCCQYECSLQLMRARLASLPSDLRVS